MNIKEHIEAGHYPTDDKGRALVPMNNGDTFVVSATDKPRIGRRHNCIAGWRSHGLLDCFDSDGRADCDARALLPPPPRTIPVRIKLKHYNGNFVVWDLEGVFPEAWCSGTEIELSGDATVPW